MKNFEEGEILENVNHSVFITIYSRKIKKIKSIKREIPGVIVIFRSDGRLGFPGGKVESTDYEGKLTTDGLNEAARFLGLEVSNNSEYIQFLQLVLGTIKEQNKKHSIHDKKRPFLFNSECVPAESLGTKGCNWS